MNNITMREISAEKEELLNRRVQKLNGLPSKKKKFPIRKNTQDLQYFARNGVAWQFNHQMGACAF